MSSSRGFAVTMAMSAVLLLLVVVAEGQKLEGSKESKKHHKSGMGGNCGRNETCRKISRECKKLLFATMVDNYAGGGNDEIVTSFEKMVAMMQMLMEHKKNLTDCANETDIELPNSGGYGGGGWHVGRGGRHRGQGGRHGNRGGAGMRGGRAGRDIMFGGKWHDENFGVTVEEATELRKCILNKTERLNPDGTLNRETLKAQISPSYSSHPGVQTAVEEAVDTTCPKPQDYNIHEFMKCINKACIDNLKLDDDGDGDGEE